MKLWHASIISALMCLLALPGVAGIPQLPGDPVVDADPSRFGSLNVMYAFDGESGGDNMGLAIARAGDLDGDGVEDFAVGLAYHDGLAGPDCGQVVFYSGADRSVIRKVDGTQSGEQFGMRLLLLGDLNQDGKPEMMASAPAYDAGSLLDAGRVAIISGLDGAIIGGFGRQLDNGFFGFSLALCGDLNNSGRPEVLIGAPGPSTGTGWAYVYTVSGHQLLAMNGDAPGDYFGYSACVLKNKMTGKTKYLLVSAPYHDKSGRPNAGQVKCYSARSGAYITSILGAHQWDYFGWDLNGEGDFNNDGHTDLLIGTPLYDGVLGAKTGQIRVLSGVNGAEIHAFEGTHEKERFGQTVDYIADIDGDGIDEIVVGSLTYATSQHHKLNGRVSVYSGSTGAHLYDCIGTGKGGYVGAGLTRISDIDGDGHDDILAGAPSFDRSVGKSDAGRIFIYSGVDGSGITYIEGEKGGDEFGYCVEGATTDVDGDGLCDFLISAYGHNDPETPVTTGRVYVVSSASGSVLYSVDGDQSEAMFGGSLAGVGDVNGDNIGDFWVGIPYYDDGGKSNCGQIRLYLGGQTTHTVSLCGSEAGDEVGHSMSRIGDLDGDGKDDLLVGLPGFKNDRGKVMVLSGDDGDLIRVFQGGATNDNFGHDVASGGDIDNDGTDDILIGVPGFDMNGINDRGRVFVYSGDDGSLLKVMNGAGEGDELGGAVDGIGDINGDGYDDFIAGAPHYDGAAGNWCGAVYVVSGRNFSIITTIEGEDAYGQFGHALAGVGDTNLDSVPDFCIGAYYLTVKEVGDAGRVYVYSGSDMALLDSVTGDGKSMWLGFSVSAVGDLDSDGSCEIMVGGPLYDVKAPDVPNMIAGNHGKVYVFSLKD